MTIQEPVRTIQPLPAQRLPRDAVAGLRPASDLNAAPAAIPSPDLNLAAPEALGAPAAAAASANVTAAPAIAAERPLAAQIEVAAAADAAYYSSLSESFAAEAENSIRLAIDLAGQGALAAPVHPPRVYQLILFGSVRLDVVA